MTVKELRAALEGLPDDMPVMAYHSRYGEIWETDPAEVIEAFKSPPFSGAQYEVWFKVQAGQPAPDGVEPVRMLLIE
jgi:hypothetical protein